MCIGCKQTHAITSRVFDMTAVPPVERLVERLRSNDTLIVQAFED